VGQFVHDDMEGEGTITLREGSILQGTFKSNQLVQGKLTHANGDVYEGAFKPDPAVARLIVPRRHGFGTFTEKGTGTRYEGLSHDACA
jgi:hypothetical protein